MVDLNFSGAEYVAGLEFDGSPAANGSWGATGSGAANIDDTHFTGTGILYAGSPTPYDAWAVSYGVLGAGPSADPDSDTRDNFYEFVFGTNPTLSDNVPLTVTDGTIFTPRSPTISFATPFIPANLRARFIRRKDYLTSGLTYSAQFSANMVTWEDSTDVPTTISDAGGAYESVDIPYGIFTSNGKKATFFRVTVTQAP